MTFGRKSNPSLLTKVKDTNFAWDGSPFLSNDFTESHDIISFAEFISPAFCKAFLGFFEHRSDWVKSVTYGEVAGGVDPASSPRQSDQINLGAYPCADKHIHGIFNKALNEYRSIYEHTDISSDEGYSLLRYGPGGAYSAHVDRGSSNHRELSGLIYLNDDYEGGGLHFPRQGITIQPKTGMVVLFPSSHTHLHASLPITKGTKYAIVTWFK